MLIKRTLCVLAGALFVSGPVAAADFDGTRPLACAIVEAVECVPGAGCVKVQAEELNFPQFLFIDFGRKLISGTRPNQGEKLEAAIVGQTSQEGSTILQGAQSGRGWTVALENQNGRMTVTATGYREGFVLFGSCIPHSGERR